MKNRLLSIFLSVIMMLLIPMVVYANTSGDSAQTIINYGVGESFVANVPAEITLSPESGGQIMSITISNVLIGKDREIAVQISSENYEDGWRLIDNNNSTNYLEYEIMSYEGKKFTNNEVAFIYDEAIDSGTVEYGMGISIKEITNAGSYSDALTFIFNVRDTTRIFNFDTDEEFIEYLNAVSDNKGNYGATYTYAIDDGTAFYNYFYADTEKVTIDAVYYNDDAYDGEYTGKEFAVVDGTTYYKFDAIGLGDVLDGIKITSDCKAFVQKEIWP